MKFSVEGYRSRSNAYRWEARVTEVTYGGWEGAPIYGEAFFAFALTRWGLGREVKRKCRQYKKRKEAPEVVPSVQEWTVDV